MQVLTGTTSFTLDSTDTKYDRYLAFIPLPRMPSFF